ncbi:MAG: GtrA family protein [Firmicutes bacterium]|nr:GtrA family protein [Bacillota bacterium]
MGNFIQFIKFSIVGASNTILTLLAYSLLVYFGVYYVAANIIGYSIGVLNSYFWNSRWVFTQTASGKSTVYKFVCVNLIVLCLTTGILFALVTFMNGNEYLSQIAATVVGLGINYVLNKIWTFK